MKKVAALIVAGGIGKRFGGTTPKQFLYIGNKMVLEYSIDVFQRCELVSEIYIMLPFGYDNIGKQIMSKYDKIKTFGIGREERAKTVYHGLAMMDKSIEFVAIHDAVRPCLNDDDLINVINQAILHRCAALGVKAKDTIKMVEEGYIVGTIDRDKIYYIQTPQVFEYNLIYEAHKRFYEKNLTDDLAYVELMGIKPKIVEGSYSNIKITTPEDLLVAERLLELRK